MKRQFLDKVNKIDIPLAILIKKRQEKTQIINNRNERGDINTNSTYIKRIIREYYKLIHVNQFKMKWTESLKT